jgi:hypothetical protein
MSQSNILDDSFSVILCLLCIFLAFAYIYGEDDDYDETTTTQTYPCTNSLTCTPADQLALSNTSFGADLCANQPVLLLIRLSPSAMILPPIDIRQ